MAPPTHLQEYRVSLQACTTQNHLEQQPTHDVSLQLIQTEKACLVWLQHESNWYPALLKHEK